jgi:signal transduction histidine kinase/ActR/RegA family two-component response regulator
VHDGKIAGLVVVFRDVTRDKQAAAERESLLTIAEQARAEAERSREMIARVQRIGDAMLADLPLDDLLREVLIRVQETVHSDTAVILVHASDAGGGELRTRAAVGLDDDASEQAPIRTGEYFAGRVARERQPLVWNEVDPAAVSPRLRRRGVRALAGVPLISGDRLLGVLHVGSVTARVFHQEDVELLQLAAERIALGIERSARSDAEKQAREIAEAASRAKDEFLAMLGHELRNPLAAVRNAVAAARLNDSQRSRALEIAGRQAEQLGRLIDDLLDVARITQGMITLRKACISLAQIVERAIESTRPFVDACGLRLALEVRADDMWVEADPARLEQVFVNLLSNAAKYTEAGGRIDVLLERRNGQAIVRIRDTGIGIAPDMLPRVWDLFAQSARTLDRAYGGLGIGLTVARRLVELHGACIEAHSDGLGKGATFTVSFPVLAVAGEGRPDVASASTSRRSVRVLVVEDNPDIADSLRMLLEVLGHRVRTVGDGVAALEAARANVPDVMLVDIGLPGIDGYEVARRVRRDPDLEQTVLIALTGYGREEDRARALAAGFDYHLVKPLSPDALNGLVTWLGKDSSDDRTVH